MKRFVFGMTALVCAMSGNAQSKAALYDSTKVEQLQEVVVKGGVRTDWAQVPPICESVVLVTHASM